jgi:hypothetical protein
MRMDERWMPPLKGIGHSMVIDDLTLTIYDLRYLERGWHWHIEQDGRIGAIAGGARLTRDDAQLAAKQYAFLYLWRFRYAADVVAAAEALL